jgi:hypothetical protein
VNQHYDDDTIPYPDFVIVGSPAADGGVVLLASQELNDAELRAEVPLPDVTAWPALAAPKPRYFITAQMRTYVIIWAPDYPAAWRSLFEHWAPKPHGLIPLGRAVPGIEP